MGRREKPVDPSAGPVQRFAYELRKLRAEAGGPTYRQLAARGPYSVTALSQAAAGDRLPSLPVALAYAEGCGGDPGEWEWRWRQAAAEEAEEPLQQSDAAPPYRGLARFEPGDRDRFFGRDRLTADLVELVSARRFAAVFGPSGSGKSSLLRAGLVPALQAGGVRGAAGEGDGRDPGEPAAEAGERGADVGERGADAGGPGADPGEPSAEPVCPPPAALRILTPGEHPLRTHADVLDAASAEGDTYLLVDQFEEVFTLCQDPEERAAFVDRLVAARDPARRLRVVIAVRADFYGRCAEHRALTEALRDAQLLVGPMSPAELREAVVKPAAAEGLIVERALTARILKDVDGEPGALPLMSHVLLETWHRRRGRALTEEAYEAAGGVRGAIAGTAERVYGELTPDRQQAARRALLRLVSPGEGSQDTRRPAPRAELAEITSGRPAADGAGAGNPSHNPPSGSADVGHVLERLVEARLLTLDDDVVDLAHEALLTAWPRLHGWIEEDRERMRALRRLTEAAHGWEELDRDPGALYRGSRLAQAEELFAGRPQELTGREAAFLAASTAARGRERRRFRGLLTTLVALLVLALVAGSFAWQQDRAADAEHRRAEARRVAAVAGSLRFTDPVRAMQLSVAAWRLADTPETRGALLGALHQRESDSFALPQSGEPRAQRFLDADGRTVTSVGRDRVERWDVATHRRLDSGPGLGHPADESDFQLSPDGRTLAVAQGDGGVRLRPGGGDIPGTTGWFGPSGRTYLSHTWSFDGERTHLALYDVRTREKLFSYETGTGDTGWFSSVSPDDRLVVVCPSSGPPEVWRTGERQRMLRAYPEARDACGGDTTALEFTPDSRGIVVMNDSGFRVLDVATGRKRLEVEREGLSEIQFSRDGSLVAAVGPDELIVWRTADVSAPVLRHPLVSEYATELRVTPGNGELRYLSGLSGHVVRTVRLDGIAGPGWHERRLEGAVFSPDGGKLVTARRSGARGVFEVRDMRGGRTPQAPPPLPCRVPRGLDPVADFCIPLMAFSPDGRRLAYALPSVMGDEPERVRVWDTRTGRMVRTMDVTPDPSRVNPLNSLAFGAGGKLILSRIPDRESLEVWDVARGERVRRLRDTGGDPLALHPAGRLLATGDDQLVALRGGRVTPRPLAQDGVRSVEFSPDGRFLAAGDDSGRVTLWDGEGRRRLGVLPGTYRGMQTGAAEPATALAFSPDGRTLAVAGHSGTLRLWDTASNQSLGGSLPTAGDELLAVSFSPDGSEVYAVGRHTSPRAYPADPERARQAVCARAGGGLSRADWEAYLPGTAYRDTC
ncbi:DNA-binding protein [Streptomyces sp. WMMC500]|uniref:nSTAND1 domain-containing NTPase n=1 Tax=Streptomyces sp. WMMC500 TaxID=3015154 RepID=UPI00248B65E0|nr:DNA-binding protein [Streptomyces sp. WMMC500]WBB59816.1 DNA-binding protein [Streptomyces sp. WMMC500]